MRRAESIGAGGISPATFSISGSLTYPLALSQTQDGSGWYGPRMGIPHRDESLSFERGCGCRSGHGDPPCSGGPGGGGLARRDGWRILAGTMSRRPKETCHDGFSNPCAGSISATGNRCDPCPGGPRSVSRRQRSCWPACCAPVRPRWRRTSAPLKMSPSRAGSSSARLASRSRAPRSSWSVRSVAPRARTLPAWAGEGLIRTDAEGKFRLEFPAEQVAERRLCIAMRIRHPGFIGRKSRRVALADLIRGQARGEEPFFAKLTLERGVEYTGQVVVPGGKPAAGIPYVFDNGTSGTSRPIPLVVDDYEGQTDDGGRIRLRMPKTQALALFVGPPRTAGARFPFAPYQHFWGIESRLQAPGCLGPHRPGPDRAVARDPTLGPAGRHGRPAHRRPDNHRVSFEGPRSPLDHDRGRRQLHPWPAPPRELPDLWRRTGPIQRRGFRCPSASPARPRRPAGAGLYQGGYSPRAPGASRDADGPGRGALRRLEGETRCGESHQALGVCSRKIQPEPFAPSPASRGAIRPRRSMPWSRKTPGSLTPGTCRTGLTRTDGSSSMRPGACATPLSIHLPRTRRRHSSTGSIPMVRSCRDRPRGSASSKATVG